MNTIIDESRVCALLTVAVLVFCASCGGLSLDQDERLARAKEAQASGDYAAAAIDLRTFLQQDPDHAEARLLLGEALLRTRDIGGAEKEFANALALLEADVAAADTADQSSEDERLDRVYRARMGLTVSRLALRNFAAAHETATALVAQRPDNLVSRLMAGQAAFSAQQFEDARVHLEFVLDENPDYAQGNLMLGLINMREGRLDAAESYIDRTLSLQPNNNGVRVIVTRLKAYVGKPIEALTALVPLLEQTLTDTRILKLFESIDLSSEPVSSEVLTLSDRLRQESPESAVPYILLARAHFLRQSYDGAAEAYDAAASRGAGRYAVVGSFLAHRRSGDAAAARNVLDTWLQSNPDDSALRAMLASSYVNSEELDSAVAEYDRLLADEGRDPAVLNNLAWLYGELGDERAIELAREAYRAAPENPSIIDTLGWLLVQNGELEEGIDILRDAVRRAPDVEEIRFHLATALAESGAEDEANRILAETLTPEPAMTGELPSEQ